MTTQDASGILNHSEMIAEGDRVTGALGHRMRCWFVSEAGGPSFDRTVLKIHGYCKLCGALGVVYSGGRCSESATNTVCTPREPAIII